MKNVTLLIAMASAFLATATASQAEEYLTLSNFGDSVELKKGETAFIVTASQDLTIQYEKKNQPKQRSQFKLGVSKQNNKVTRVSSSDKRFLPTWSSPFPLSGPAKIKLVTSGVVGMRLIEAK